MSRTLSSILKEVLLELDNDPKYSNLSELDQDFYITQAMMVEMFNPNETYEYTTKRKGLYTFVDRHDVEYYVYFPYMPAKDYPYFEFKVGYTNDNGEVSFKDPSGEKSTYDSLKSNTIAKIYRDECIPRFLDQDLTGDIKIFPFLNDSRRYDYGLRLVKKFPIPDTEIIEDKPHFIIVRLKNFVPKKDDDDDSIKF